MSSRFFFSSRRRHTRSTRDWSSDVCSSDLFSNGTLKSTRDSQITMCHPFEIVGVEEEDIFIGSTCAAQRVDAAGTQTSVQLLFVNAVARGKANERGAEKSAKQDCDQNDRNVFCQSVQSGSLSAKK